MIKKIIKISLLSIVALLVVVLATITIFHFSFKVKAEDTIVNNTGMVQASGKALYDEDGNKIILRGINLGGWFVTEGWLEPYAISDAKIEEVDGEMRPVYYTTNFRGDILNDKMSQDEMLKALKSNPNLSEQDRKDVLNEFYKNWITENDFDIIKEMGFNMVRIPLGWRMFLNDDYTAKTDSELDESLLYLDKAIKWSKDRDIYVTLDLHSCPKSQNGYEHGGSYEWVESTAGKEYAVLYDHEDAIDATVKVWELISKRYNTLEYKTTICMYDLMNEPRDNTGSTTKKVWDVYDKIYQKLREMGDNHCMTMEGIWAYSTLPNPKKYGWSNVCYQIHPYNFSFLNKTEFGFELYYIYQDMFFILHNYDCPTYIGEFSLFDTGSGDSKFDKTYARWERGLSMWEERGWSWSPWTYKKVVNGWWDDSWGIILLHAAEEQGAEYDVRVNIAKATKDEIMEAFSYENIGTPSCDHSTMYEVFKKYNTEHK